MYPMKLERFNIICNGIFECCVADYFELGLPPSDF